MSFKERQLHPLEEAAHYFDPTRSKFLATNKHVPSFIRHRVQQNRLDIANAARSARKQASPIGQIAARAIVKKGNPTLGGFQTEMTTRNGKLEPTAAKGLSALKAAKLHPTIQRDIRSGWLGGNMKPADALNSFSRNPKKDYRASNFFDQLGDVVVRNAGPAADFTANKIIKPGAVGAFNHIVKPGASKGIDFAGRALRGAGNTFVKYMPTKQW